MRPPSIPLVLVTGFLGSGKTTFLRRIATRHVGRKLAFLVNEFSALDVDGTRLADVAPNVVALPGGSIFCRCLSTEFIREMKTLPERFGPATLEAVVIEASGMANPLVVQSLLEESKLNAIYHLSTVVALLDPGSFLKLLETLPNIAAQVQAADVIIVNKVDLYPAEQIQQTESEAKRLNPSAPLLRARYAEAELELFGLPPERRLQGELAPCTDPRYAVLVARPALPIDGERLRQAVEALTPSLYRAKGFVAAKQGYLYLDFAAGRACMETLAEKPAQLGLTFIVRGTDSRTAEQLVAQINAGAFAAGT